MQSLASWPELATGTESRLTSGRLMMRPSLVELQRLRPALKAGGGSVARGRAKLRVNLMLLLYALTAVSIGGLLAITFWQHPLHHLEMLNGLNITAIGSHQPRRSQVRLLTWCRAWLLTLAADHLGSSLCIASIIVASEPPCRAALWVCGSFVIGSPASLLYLLLRLHTVGSVRLTPRQQKSPALSLASCGQYTTQGR